MNCIKEYNALRLGQLNVKAAGGGCGSHVLETAETGHKSRSAFPTFRQPSRVASRIRKPTL